MNSTYAFLQTEEDSKTKTLLDKGCYERGCRDFMLAKKLTFSNYIVILFTAILLMSVVSSFAQTLTPKEWEAIQKSNDYLIGMGVNANIEEARQMALSDLASKISTNVSSRFDYELINENKGMAVNSEARMKNVINSYSNVALKDVEEHVVKDKHDYVIYRYMKKSDMEAMFKRRVNLAKQWANDAIKREKEGKVGDALRNFYWSLALLNSCPDADKETITIDYYETSMNQDIHHRVDEILDAITVKATSVETDSVGQYLTLKILYHGKPVTNFDYKYYDGNQYSEVFTAKDGEGDLLIPLSVNINRLKILAEYECRDEASIHPEIRSVMELTDTPAFKAELSVDTKDCRIFQIEPPTIPLLVNEKIEDTASVDSYPPKINLKGNLPYGHWSGTITDGKPFGIGTMTFTSPTEIRCANESVIKPQAGEKITDAEFDENGYLYQGTWIKQDGNTKTIMP